MDIPALVSASLSLSADAAVAAGAAGQYRRIAVEEDIEFECLFAAYFAHFSAGHVQGMRETLADINNGLVVRAKRSVFFCSLICVVFLCAIFVSQSYLFFFPCGGGNF